MTRKHDRRGTGRGAYELLDARDRLGLYHLTGTIRYAPAHATR